MLLNSLHFQLVFYFISLKGRVIDSGERLLIIKQPSKYTLSISALSKDTPTEYMGMRCQGNYTNRTAPTSLFSLPVIVWNMTAGESEWRCHSFRWRHIWIGLIYLWRFCGASSCCPSDWFIWRSAQYDISQPVKRIWELKRPLWMHPNIYHMG